MLCGIASPVSLLRECAARGTYHLALSHLILESEEYRDFYREESERGIIVGVDNGLVEQGESLPLSSVLEAAKAVEAKEIVLPDVLGDADASLGATLDGLVEYQSRDEALPYRLMAVPHGDTAADWLTSYVELLQIQEISVIGISMFDSDLFPGGRVGLLDSLEDWGLIDPTKRYHMLGCWKDIREAYGLAFRSISHAHSYGWYPAPRKYVRSMDTGLPVRWGLQGLVCPKLTSPKRPPEATHRHDDFNAPVEMNDSVRMNVRLYQSCCAGLVS